MSVEPSTEAPEDVVLRLIASGRLKASDIVRVVHGLDDQGLAAEWRAAAAIVESGMCTAALLARMEVLAAADPEFTSAGFLLGMGSYQLHRFAEAAAHFEAHVDAGGTQSAAASTMLRRLRGSPSGP